MTVTEVPADRPTRNATRLLQAALFLVIAVTPLLVDPGGRDLFRVGKTAFFQGAMLVIGAIAAVAALRNDAFAASLIRHRRAVILGCAGVAWVAIVSVTSTLPAVSRSAPFSIFCHALLFVIAVAVLRSGEPLAALGALLAPAVVNAVLIVLQALDLWEPFGVAVEGSDRYGNVGLIGNPNTAGTYLLVPVLAALAATVALRRWRALFGTVTIVLLAGLFLAQTITVMFGLTVALLAFAATGTKRTRLFAIGVVVAGIIGVLAYTPTRERLVSLAKLLRRGNYQALTTNRLPAAAATLNMFLDRPLLGLGPGVFAARYMPYRLAAEERNPHWIQLARENFGEAHNDHLQVLAETGLPGYVLLAAMLFSIAAITVRRTVPDDDRGRFTRLFALPAAAGFAAVALGQFPLELTAVSSTCVFAAALCFAWGSDASR